MTAGKLRHTIRFERRSDAPDGYGNTLSTWAGEYECRAAMTWLRGGENVLAARLQGVRTVALMIRDCAAARALTADYRAVDKQTGDVFNIRSVSPNENRAYLDVLCETGVASG